MENDIWKWIVEFFNSEHKGILREVIVGLTIAAITGLTAKVFLSRKRSAKRNSLGDPTSQSVVLEKVPSQPQRNKLYRPRFELVGLKRFSNSNGSCRYVFVIENAGGLAFNVYVTSDDFAGEINLKDIGRRDRREISFSTNGPVYEVCFDFKFDFPDGSSSTASLPVHARTDGKWYSGGVEAG